MTRQEAKEEVLASNISGLGEVRLDGVNGRETVFAWGMHPEKPNPVKDAWMNIHAYSSRLMISASQAIFGKPEVKYDQHTKNRFVFCRLFLDKEMAHRMACNLENWAINNTISIGENKPWYRPEPISVDEARPFVWEVTYHMGAPDAEAGNWGDVDVVLVRAAQRTMTEATEAFKATKPKGRRVTFLSVKYVGRLEN